MALTVQWRNAPGARARTVHASVVDCVGKQVAVLAEAERRAGLARDITGSTVVARSGAGLAAAQRALGETLYALLDGPDRALTRRLEDARRAGAALHLVVRLHAANRKALARHRALGWHLPLVASAEGPLALASDVTIAVQLGDAEVAARETVVGGRLQVLFMAYSPRDVVPVLDFEAEEERILTELAPFVEERRLVLKVAEDGSLDELQRRLMRRAYDVVHLTGHGVVTDQGPRLVMEDPTGDRDDVSAEQLVKTLRAGRAMPRLVVISSCHSAEQRANLPSFAAELIAGGVPCVVGWTRPVRDNVANDAAEVLYRRLCSGDMATEAVACARRELDRDDQGRPVPAHAWATLELLTTKLPGFAIDPGERPVREAAPAPASLYRMLGSRMRVLDKGFVGRRRELQALGKILRHGRWAPAGEAERAVAGALVVGMKGQGKSCLVGRALDRHQQDSGALSLVVLHGELDELQLVEAFRTEAVRLGDDAAERMLGDASRSAARRIERLLRHHWREHQLVIVLDDFEQNLEIPAEGEAQLQPLAAELLEVVLPVCRDEQPKLLVTSTARFTLAAPLAGLLAEVRLGALDGASVRKLWMRGRSTELAGMGPGAWSALCERFGRNARILDWARQLLSGKTPDEVRKVMAEADAALPVWQDQPVDDEKADALVTAFLRHMAYADAVIKVGLDAMTFIERARVYEVPVPVEAFAELTTDLAISLDRHVPALANLGLLEMGSEGSRAVYRVSPLVKPVFDAIDDDRWHGIAAEYWWQVARQRENWGMPEVIQAWEHALLARRQDIADEAADLLGPWLDVRGAYGYSAVLGARHVAAFPNSVAGLNWAGYAQYCAGAPRKGRRLLERAMVLADEDSERCDCVTDNFARVLAVLGEYAAAAHYLAELVVAEEGRNPDGSSRLGSYLHSHAGVLLAQGRLTDARARLERSLEIRRKVHGTEDHPDIAASLHALASVLLAQGDLEGARAQLEWSLRIKRRVHGTDDHPDIAASLHELARVLRTQGDLVGARTRLEQSLEIQQTVYGIEDHPDVATSLHELARVLRAQGDLAGARVQLKRSLEIQWKVHGTEDHPAVAASLHELARVLLAQGDLAGARARLERALEIKRRLHGTEEHLELAASFHVLAGVLFAQGDLAGARVQLEQSLAIKQKVHGTEDHPAVAASLHELARVLIAQGDPTSARTRLERALEIQRKIHGTEDHLAVAASLHELARALRAQGDLVGARATLVRSLEIRRKVHGMEDHPDVVSSLHELARVLSAQGDLASARARLERALEIQQKVYGTEEHLDVAVSLHEFARMLFAHGDLAGARARLERALEIQQKIHRTEDHSDVARSLHELARVLRAQGDLDGAHARLEQALEIKLEIKQKVHGIEMDHPDAAVSLNELTILLRTQGAGSSPRLERSLEIQQNFHGAEDHRNLETYPHERARVLRTQGDLAGARTWLERSLEIQKELHGTEHHPDVAASLYELAIVLRAEGDLAGARNRLERSLEILLKVQGAEDHPDVAASVHELARVLRAQEDLDGAYAWLEWLLGIKRKLHGTENHPDIATCLHELVGVLRAGVARRRLVRTGVLQGRGNTLIWLQRVILIKQRVHDMQDHPDIATICAGLGDYLHDLGRELITGYFPTGQIRHRKAFGTRGTYGFSCT